MPHLSRWLGALALGLMLCAEPAMAQTLPTVGGYKDTTGKPQQGIGVGILAPSNSPTSHVTVGTSATLIVAARGARQLVTIQNLGTTDVWIGGSGVTASNGALLTGKGSSLTLPTTTAWYGIVASGSQDVALIETY